jgi:hypothetical protein
MVHAFGCRLAANQNRNQIRAGKKADRVYCGAYRLLPAEIHELARTENLAEVKKAEVLHAIEDGEFAHANLRFEIDTQGDEEAIEPIKTLIVDRLWKMSSGPEKHVCSCDDAALQHPSEELLIGPQGVYRDPRTQRQINRDVALYFMVHFPRLWVSHQGRLLFAWAKNVAGL